MFIRRLFSLLTLVSLVLITGCIDNSKLTTENLKKVINQELSTNNIYIAIPGQSLESGTMIKPYVIFDPDYENENSTNSVYDNMYQQGLLDYAITLENAKLLTMTRGTFKRKVKFVGLVDSNGYALSYIKDIDRTISPTKYPGIFKAMIGNLEVREFVKTTNPYIEDGVKTIDVDVHVKIANKLDSISEEVIIASYAYEEISRAVMSYKLYLDEVERRWKIKSTKSTKIDVVKRFYRSICSTHY